MGNRDREKVSGELRNNCYDNPKQECNNVQNVTQEKECEIVTDCQCKVENVRQCRQVAEKGAIRSLKELALLGVSKNAKLRVSESALQRRLDNATGLVNNPVCNGIYCAQCSAMMCPKKSVGMNLDSPVNRFPRKRLG